MLPKAGDNRMLFMPHSSPGVYIALILKDAKEILLEENYNSDTLSQLSYAIKDE